MQHTHTNCLPVNEGLPGRYSVTSFLSAALQVVILWTGFKLKQAPESQNLLMFSTSRHVDDISIAMYSFYILLTASEHSAQ